MELKLGGTRLNQFVEIIIFGRMKYLVSLLNIQGRILRGVSLLIFARQYKVLSEANTRL